MENSFIFWESHIRDLFFLFFLVICSGLCSVLIHQSAHSECLQLESCLCYLSRCSEPSCRGRTFTHQHRFNGIVYSGLTTITVSSDGSLDLAAFSARNKKETRNICVTPSLPFSYQMHFYPKGKDNWNQLVDN